MKRIRTDVWQTSDNRLWLDRAEAHTHELRLRLAKALDPLHAFTTDQVVDALLGSKDFHIVLTHREGASL